MNLHTPLPGEGNAPKFLKLLHPEVNVIPGQDPKRLDRKPGWLGLGSVVLELWNTSPLVTAYTISLECDEPYWQQSWWKLSGLKEDSSAGPHAPDEPRDPEPGDSLTVHVNSRQKRLVMIEFRLPQSAEARSKVYNARIVVKSKSDATKGILEPENVEPLKVVVRSFPAFRIACEPEKRHFKLFRRRGRYELKVTNKGNDWLYLDIGIASEGVNELTLSTVTTAIAVPPAEPRSPSERSIPLFVRTHLRTIKGDEISKELPLIIRQINAPTVPPLADPIEEQQTANLGASVLTIPLVNPAKPDVDGKMVYHPPIPASFSKFFVGLVRNVKGLVMLCLTGFALFFVLSYAIQNIRANLDRTLNVTYEGATRKAGDPPLPPSSQPKLLQQGAQIEIDGENLGKATISFLTSKSPNAPVDLQPTDYNERGGQGFHPFGGGDYVITLDEEHLEQKFGTGTVVTGVQVRRKLAGMIPLLIPEPLSCNFQLGAGTPKPFPDLTAGKDTFCNWAQDQKHLEVSTLQPKGFGDSVSGINASVADVSLDQSKIRLLTQPTGPEIILDVSDVLQQLQPGQHFPVVVKITHGGSVGFPDISLPASTTGTNGTIGTSTSSDAGNTSGTTTGTDGSAGTDENIGGPPPASLYAPLLGALAANRSDQIKEAVQSATEDSLSTSLKAYAEALTGDVEKAKEDFAAAAAPTTPLERAYLDVAHAEILASQKDYPGANDQYFAAMNLVESRGLSGPGASFPSIAYSLFLVYPGGQPQQAKTSCETARKQFNPSRDEIAAFNAIEKLADEALKQGSNT